MEKGISPIKYGETKNLKKYDLSIAEDDKQLKFSASVITKDNIIRDSLNYSGIRVITFANILKFKKFPLVEILNFLLEIGEKSLGCPVELEFASFRSIGKSEELKSIHEVLSVLKML